MTACCSYFAIFGGLPEGKKSLKMIGFIINNSKSKIKIKFKTLPFTGPEVLDVK